MSVESTLMMVSMGRSLLRMGYEALRLSGKTDEEIDAEYESSKQKVKDRPADVLPEV